MNPLTPPSAGKVSHTRESPASVATRYRPGFRPRCQACQQEPVPCPILDHEYPQRMRYAGFSPCPAHPGAGVMYPTIPT
jgi:hypothetical protein